MGYRLRVIVTGSRDWRDVGMIDGQLAHFPDDTVIIQGCASGADAIARSLALALGYTVEDYWPNYVDYEFADANKRRNQEMVSAGADLALAFPTARSRGTWDCVTKAVRAGIPVKIVNADGTSRHIPEV